MQYRHIPLILISALTTIATAAQANPYAPAPSGSYSSALQEPVQPQPRQRTPLDVLEDGIAMLQDFISSGDIYDQDKLEMFVETQVKPFFDFDQMSRLVAGRFYRDMNEEQRDMFQSRLEDMFMIAFTRQVSQHAGPQPQVDFLRPRFKGPDEVEALARVLFPDGSAKRLVFRFHRGERGWRIYDVAANGTSAVLYYRRHFLDRVRRTGPDALLN